MITPNSKDDVEVTLKDIESWKTVYALCDIDTKTGRLQATHYAACLLYGRTPTWAIFSGDTGRLQFLFDSRFDIENHRYYRNKAWRTKQSAIKLGRVTSLWSPKDRHDFIEDQLPNTKKKHTSTKKRRVNNVQSDLRV